MDIVDLIIEKCHNGVAGITRGQSGGHSDLFAKDNSVVLSPVLIISVYYCGLAEEAFL